MADYLELMPGANKSAVRQWRAENEARLARPKKGFLRFQEPWRRTCTLPAAEYCDFTGDTVLIGRHGELTGDQARALHESMRAFMPWRKGPFSLYGLEIDAEWRSWRKWDRLAPGLPELKNKVVADIGCNNGYYMFRMLPRQPAAVVGFEPMLQHYYCCKSLQHLAGQAADRLSIEAMGVEQIGFYPGSFDVIFLMGIIYHRREPLTMLAQLKEALRPGGTLIVESQAIPGRESLALFPEHTYAKAPGVYFVPTAACLHNWLNRSGFKEVQLISQVPTSPEEQRRTAWMTFESYADFLDPENPQQTIEGYPSPDRVIFSAKI
ncbi:tRNA 5-methoxyuridine(34)/uridine 5-oxyacetic acid(34) synthase CmoB [Desulfurivibrio dismutans]|uniref:tRNA 5-methoxyuridine(34)/uridine 5-oxyacetic acid(34) synthase CmoB n=1 Tax=Desulfurivibrio dismutans TaxID=1398908 RepID=UPI0023D9B93C|nr:tRNA 5-methoxyuridine(34)/uridine 5-oxyacetic acid(34) synthase CmoB [Desulfurivibrio alkaliphilus]MDF1613713.1 tRNA 5-methoxyuridine(34)/uridine 5-oxyacetic acid(34) synthase CmoB [Desulfurivibrio alkaliphilus]